MKTETSKVLALVTAVVMTGVGAVEMTRNSAQANPPLVAGATGYAAERIEGGFQAVAEIPRVAPMIVPVAMKGDRLPSGCAGPFEPTFAAECVDTAYEVESGPYVVVEARAGSTSILSRMMGYTLAGL